MKCRTWSCVFAVILFAALALPVQLAAQDKAEPNHPHEYHHYQLIDPGTFGGPASYNESDPPESIINDRGAAVGGADTSVPDPFAPNCFGYIDCFVTDAYVWQGGVLTDLGALIPGYSSFASTINARGEAVGVSENGQIDPLTGNYEALAVLWENGIVKTKRQLDLPPRFRAALRALATAYRIGCDGCRSGLKPERTKKKT